MKAIDYLPLALRAAEVVTDPLRLREWKFEDVTNPRDASAADNIPRSSGPLVLWRMSENVSVTHLDGPVDREHWFEIECRSPTRRGAWNMAEDILYRFRLDQVLLDIVSRFDEEADRAQKSNQYFSHIIEVSLPEDGCPDIE